MTENDFDFGARAISSGSGPIPSVYMFQPAYYVVLTNDELAQWQQVLQEKVGLTAEDVPINPNIAGCYSLCGSTYFSEACDCDELPPEHQD